VDSGVGDDPKSSKTYRRQRQRLRTGRLSLLRVEARETELPDPAPAGSFFLAVMSQGKYFCSSAGIMPTSDQIDA